MGANAPAGPQAREFNLFKIPVDLRGDDAGIKYGGNIISLLKLKCRDMRSRITLPCDLDSDSD